MAERTALKKSLRFEVFKRDGFTCQYCGRSAPDVILHADHINPVAEGGETDLLNLITSCSVCNLGKGAKPLSDDTAVERQKRQLQELNERRLQMEEMIRWREDLRDLQEQSLNRVVSYFEAWTSPVGLNDNARAGLRKLIKKYGVEETLTAIDIAAESYVQHDGNGPTRQSVEAAYVKLPGILFNRSNPDRARYSQDAYYVRGILRRRVNVNERLIMDMLAAAEQRNIDMDAVKDLAKTCRSWTEFRTAIDEFNETHDVED